jgi:hypothetical protein
MANREEVMNVYIVYVEYSKAYGEDYRCTVDAVFLSKENADTYAKEKNIEAKTESFNDAIYSVSEAIEVK